MARTIQEEATKLRQNLDRVYRAGYHDGVHAGGGGGGYTEEEVNEAYRRGFNEGTDEGIATGKEQERSDFWETFQDEGLRDNYSYAFRTQYWTDKLFNPIYPITGELKQTFHTTGITHIKAAVVANGAIDYCFQAGSLITIDHLDLTNATNVTRTFYNNYSITNITFYGSINIDGLDLSACSNLTKETLLSLVAALANKSEDTSGTTWTVTVGNTNKAKLTDEEWAPAKAKGWTVK